MKKTILIGATLAIVGLASAPLFAQTQSTTTTSTTGYIQSSSVIGSKIKDSRGQDVGEIKDFVLDRQSGCLAYVVLSTRGTGTTTATTKTVAAPWSVFSPSSEARVYTTRIERERIYSAPVWESTRYEEYSRPEYISSVYGYYGVTVPNFSVGVTSTSGTTTTGATTTSSSASTLPSATPAATAAATATPAPAATMTPSASATVSKASPTVAPSATAKPAASATAAPASTAKSPAESATKSSPASSPKTSSSSTSTATDKKTTEDASKKTDKATKTDSSTSTSTSTTESSPKADKSKKSSEASPAPTP